MKKIILILLAVMVLVAGCGSKPEPQPLVWTEEQVIEEAERWVGRLDRDETTVGGVTLSKVMTVEGATPKLYSKGIVKWLVVFKVSSCESYLDYDEPRFGHEATLKVECTCIGQFYMVVETRYSVVSEVYYADSDGQRTGKPSWIK